VFLSLPLLDVDDEYLVVRGDVKGFCLYRKLPVLFTLLLY